MHIYPVKCLYAAFQCARQKPESTYVVFWHLLLFPEHSMGRRPIFQLSFQYQNIKNRDCDVIVSPLPAKDW